MKKVSIVISLYNSENTIRSVIDEIRATFVEVADSLTYEIVLVDDRGSDDVFEVAKHIAETDDKIKIVRLAKNSGQTNALFEGFRVASGDYVVEMDDDYQMPAYEIPRMLDELESKDYDVVFAKYDVKKESGLRLLGSRVNTLMAERVLGKPKDIEINSFYIMRKFVCDAMVNYLNNYPYIYGIIFAVTDNVGNVLVNHRARTNGKSNYTLRKLVSLWSNGLLNYSVAPLRVLTKLGFFMMVVSLILIMYLVISRIIVGTESAGWTSIMICVVFFAGIELLCMGLLGEYLGRLYISSSNLPRATVRETYNLDIDEASKPDAY